MRAQTQIPLPRTRRRPLRGRAPAQKKRGDPMRVKPLLLLGLAACALLVVLNDRSSAQSAGPGDDDALRIRIGFRVAPVPLSLHAKDPNLLALGPYMLT